MSTFDSQRPRVGVGVIVRKNGKILLGRRINAHGNNTWNFPGGHLERGESPEECATREVREETSIRIKNIKKGPWTNDIFDEGKHYITIFMISDYDQGEPKIMEPHKCAEWGWFSWELLPEPYFLPLQNLLKTNFNPFKEAE